jgi:hypothetical protein
MTEMTRRNLLRLAATTALVAPLVAACTAQQIATIAQNVVNDAGLVASGLSGILPTIAAITGISATTVSSITSIAQDIASAASSITAAMSQAEAQGPVQTIEAGVDSFVQALGGISLPSAVSQVIQAAQVLLPAIETAVGIVTAVGAAPGGMSVDQARQILAKV